MKGSSFPVTVKNIEFADPAGINPILSFGRANSVEMSFTSISFRLWTAETRPQRTSLKSPSPPTETILNAKLHNKEVDYDVLNKRSPISILQIAQPREQPFEKRGCRYHKLGCVCVPPSAKPFFRM